MSQFHDFLHDATDFIIDELGSDCEGKKLFLVINGDKIPVAQSNIPRQAEEFPSGFSVYGDGQVICRKRDVLAATGGVLPQLESRAYLQVEGQTALQSVRITQVDSSHGDPSLSISLTVDL